MRTANGKGPIFEQAVGSGVGSFGMFGTSGLSGIGVRDSGIGYGADGNNSRDLTDRRAVCCVAAWLFLLSFPPIAVSLHPLGSQLVQRNSPISARGVCKRPLFPLAKRNRVRRNRSTFAILECINAPKLTGEMGKERFAFAVLFLTYSHRAQRVH